MKIVITSTGSDLESSFNPTFGRSPMFIFLEEDTQEVEAIKNPAVDAHGGAGIQAAKFVIDQGAEAIITGRVGPKAMDVLRADAVPIYIFHGNSVRQAVEAFRTGKLKKEKY